MGTAVTCAMRLEVVETLDRANRLLDASKRETDVRVFCLH